MICDTQNYVCVECLDDSDCSFGPAPEYCLPVENICVQCYQDSHCPTDMVCDTDAYLCRPTSGRALCEPCSDDSECGVAGDMCLAFFDAGGSEIDRGCGRACTANDPCPAGYRCGTVGNSTQCVPYNAEDVPTCAGIRDMGQACGLTSDTCGVAGVPDGTCVPSMGGGYCSVRCTVGDPGDPPSCIDPWACTSLAGFFEVCTIQ
jgi:hypothetical protein